MKSGSEDEAILLKWIAPSQGSDTTDPLGLELRVSARLAAQLLHCITSITPRARYYSFLAWCFTEYIRNQRKTVTDPGFDVAMSIRAKAYALGCIESHELKTCDGGSIVGSEKATELLGTERNSLDLADVYLFQNGPLDAYFGSLVNLGLFEETKKVTQNTDDESDREDEGRRRITWDDIKVTPLCESLGDAFKQSVTDLAVVNVTKSVKPVISINDLKAFGLAACPCRLSDGQAPDYQALLDLFFARKSSGHKTHLLRRRSLLLLLAYIKRAGAVSVPFNRFTFSDMIVYCSLDSDGQEVGVELPTVLNDIAEKWLMFHLHGYTATSLEGAFACLLLESDHAGQGGLALKDIAVALDEPEVLSDVLGLRSLRGRRFSELTPRELFSLADVDIDSLANGLGIYSTISERRLARILSSQGEVKSFGSGLAVAGILLAASLARLKPFMDGENGQWLASESRNPHLDVSPSTIDSWLKRDVGDWVDKPWGSWMPGLLHRFVIRQHEMMGYEKAKDNKSIILNQVDGRLFATGEYPHATIGNSRLGSALQILRDLALISENEAGVLDLTAQGDAHLAQELEAEG